jgi:hypothetical protein
MNTREIQLDDLTNIYSPDETYTEIRNTLLLVDPGLDSPGFEDIYNDVVALFNGKYPGYRASNTKYHNLEHTCAVTLATARLVHGLHVRKHKFSINIVRLGLIAALFHDTGLIQTIEESEGTGAQFTIGHEDRSVALMGKYLQGKGFTPEEIRDCGHIIRSTILSLPLKNIPFRSNETRTMGKILGSADLIAQMADRKYLEKLPLLYMEFEEAGLPGLETPLELFKNTEDFYHTVVRKRLTEEMDNIGANVVYHFRTRWGIDRDLYAESIRNNIKYMKEVNLNCAENYQCVMERINHREE